MVLVQSTRCSPWWQQSIQGCTVEDLRLEAEMPTEIVNPTILVQVLLPCRKEGQLSALEVHSRPILAHLSLLPIRHLLPGQQQQQQLRHTLGMSRIGRFILTTQVIRFVGHKMAQSLPRPVVLQDLLSSTRTAEQFLLLPNQLPNKKSLRKLFNHSKTNLDHPLVVHSFMLTVTSTNAWLVQLLLPLLATPREPRPSKMQRGTKKLHHPRTRNRLRLGIVDTNEVTHGPCFVTFLRKLQSSFLYFLNDAHYPFRYIVQRTVNLCSVPSLRVMHS